jgi:hypothetical protein
LIEHRTRSLTLEAIEHNQPWVMQFGPPPADSTRREDWLRQLGIIAAYRDRWQVNAGVVLGGKPRSREHRTQVEAAQRASIEAVRIHQHRDPDQAHTPLGCDVEAPTSLRIDRLD